MDNPLSNSDGAALRKQSEWLLFFANRNDSKLSETDQISVNGLINLLDEVRSYCHDEHGIDCLLCTDSPLYESSPPATPCSLCGSPKCHG